MSLSYNSKTYLYFIVLSYIDQLNNKILLVSKPIRIISIVPSQSELLWYLGIRKELVGITKFCIYPIQMFNKIVRVGGTKKLNINKIRELKPDLIIGNKEENDQQQIELLKKEFNVWMSDIYSFNDVFKMIRTLGVIFDKERQAKTLVFLIKSDLRMIKNIFKQKRVIYFIWNKPYMCAGQNTFINHVLNHIGLKNLISISRYPKIDEFELIKLKPDFCFLSSEPFPFKEKHINILKNILPNSKIMIVDGEIFSWYGSRLLHLKKYIKEFKKELYASNFFN